VPLTGKQIKLTPLGLKFFSFFLVFFAYLFENERFGGTFKGLDFFMSDEIN
jgi:hypothetical protein